MYRWVTLDAEAEREGASVAAIKDQHFLLRPAHFHHRPDLPALHSGELEVFAVSVRHGQVKIAVVVFDAVAGEVKQCQVIASSIPVEVADRPSHNVIRLVVQRCDLKVGDADVSQDGRQLLRVAGRGS